MEFLPQFRIALPDQRTAPGRTRRWIDDPRAASPKWLEHGHTLWHLFVADADLRKGRVEVVSRGGSSRPDSARSIRWAPLAMEAESFGVVFVTDEDSGIDDHAPPTPRLLSAQLLWGTMPRWATHWSPTCLKLLQGAHAMQWMADWVGELSGVPGRSLMPGIALRWWALSREVEQYLHDSRYGEDQWVAFSHVQQALQIAEAELARLLLEFPALAKRGLPVVSALATDPCEALRTIVEFLPTGTALRATPFDRKALPGKLKGLGPNIIRQVLGDEFRLAALLLGAVPAERRGLFPNGDVRCEIAPVKIRKTA